MKVGTLFTEDFLAEGIDLSPPWTEIDDDVLADARKKLAAVFLTRSTIRAG